MRHLATFAALCLAAACGAPELEAPAVETPTADGAAGPDATADRPALPDGGPDTAPDHELGREAGPEVNASPEAAPEAAPPLPEPAPEAAPPPDAGAPIADAAPEHAPTVCDGQAPSPPLDCTAQSSTCDSVRATNARIRAQFPAPCSCGSMKCAGVTSGTVVETVPVTCRNDSWTLAGSQSGTSWAPWFQCSRGCAAGKICDP